MSATDAQREIRRQNFLTESTFMRVSSPLFSALNKASAEDEDVLKLASATRRGQSSGQLLPCSVQYLLLKTPEPKLARYFPSLTDTPAPAEEAFPAYREFCLDRRSELSELLSSRTVNTNLVEKASILMPAVQHVSRLSDQPLTLLEICCSAGLNMLIDEYHYDYGSAGCVGPENSPVQLTCKLLGNDSPPIDGIPWIAERIGVDLVEIDPSSSSDRLWMEAVLFPEWQIERQRLRKALAVRAAHDLRIIIDDALRVLPSLLESLPGSLCILQSYCIKHWSEDAVVELEELLHRTSRNRDIHRLAIEMPESEAPLNSRYRLARLAAAGIPVLEKSFPSRIYHTLYAKGRAESQLLAQGDGFGLWLDWQALDR